MIKIKQYIIAILVANQFGVLTRVSGLFSRRGFNIDSLTVGETESPEFSRITVALRGDRASKEQIIKQLSKLHDVKEIKEMKPEETVVRELLLIKVKSDETSRNQIIDAVSVFRSKIVDYAADSICIEITGESSKINAFIDLMKPFGIIEMCRTGVVVLQRGSNCLKN